MAITKTIFINYTRCRRYSALEEIKKDKIESKMNIEDYKKEEQNEEIKELVGSMFESTDSEDIDLTHKTDIQLEAMMEYYNEVELLAGLQSIKTFGGTSTYSKETYNQESFDFVKNGIRYLCYVDIFNENENEINIIEVKSTTSKKYIDLEYGKVGGEKTPMFYKKGDIYYLNNLDSDDEKIIKSYNAKLNKLKNRYSDVGKYVYDLSVQRYIIENDLKEHNINKKINYYLGVLNTNYIYDGKELNNKRIYEKDTNGNEIIVFFDMNELTKQMQDKIDTDRKLLESYLFNSDNSKCNVGEFCSYKKNTACIYTDICFKDVPKKNASFNYLNFKTFTDANNNKLNKYDLINNGYYKFDDIPYEWLTNPNHIIQRDCYDNNELYVDSKKIKAAIDNIEYPIYHLDFETFPCPLPRFRGEKPYTQSCFEFSLHIEREPGVCDKEKDNIVYINRTTGDEREELVKLLCDSIDTSKGTMLAQNVPFEKARIKELAEIFPEYKKHLLQIHDMGYDLLYIIRNNKKMFLELGFDELESSKINYYNKELSGSFSIKKTLPLFTDLKYTDLEIQNGTQALVEYSKYKYMNHSQLQRTIIALIEYCKQDTWAMVEILRGLRLLVENNVKVCQTN